MARRIETNQPSTGKSLRINSSSVAETPSWTTLIEAPEFKVPLRSEEEALIIEEGAYEILPGELFFNSPLLITNDHPTENYWIQFKVVLEDGNEITLTSKIEVPANDTALIPIQGQILLKMNDLGGSPEVTSNGDRLQCQCEVGASSSLTLFGSASESQAGTHPRLTE